jgi:hypothetical protein
MPKLTVKQKIDKEMADQQKRASKGNKRKDDFLKRLAMQQKDAQFRQEMYSLGEQMNDATLMRSAISPNTRVKSRESELERDKEIIGELLNMRAKREFKQRVRELERSGREPAQAFSKEEE